MKSKELCLRLLSAESEKDVLAAVDGLPEFKKASSWRPLDNRETNFNVTSNQASDGGKALTELMTNMVDAVLMKHAYLKKVDPKSPKAPRTMYEAVDRLIKPMQGGKLVNLDANDPWLREFASKNLVIGITGAKNKREGLPCYTFVDNGEGQRPEDFKNTFLSLSAGNKRSIPFVQGKYNMGSSGVLGYCGRHWFKLIVSRRYDGKSPWGWTLMRRRPGDGMPVAEYFVMADGSIPSFDADVLYPYLRGDGKRYDGVHLATGTIIKLYDYQVGSKFLSFRGSREALNENLVETILPFRLLDFRQKRDPKRSGDRAEGIDPRPFYGMEFLLLRSHKEGEPAEADSDDEDTEDNEIAADASLSVGNLEDPELGEVKISAIALKRKLPDWLRNSNNRVFHAVNGQVQFKQTRGYLTDCGFPALKDRAVVIIDASNLTFAAHNDVWKGDREHIRNTIVGERYRELVTRTIHDSEALKALQIRVAREEMERAAKTERNDLFQKLVDKDPTLANLLTGHDLVVRMPVGGAGGNGDGKAEFDGRYSPTFLRLEEKIREKGIEIPMNRTRPVAAATDAENGYLNRADNPGSLVIPDKISSRFSFRTQLHDGRLTIYFDPIEGKVKVGDTFTFRFGLQDAAMPLPVETELTLRIAAEEAQPTPHKKPKPGPKPEPPGPAKLGNPNNGKNAPTRGLPKHRLLTMDGRMVGDEDTDPWPEGFTDQDGGTVRDFGDDQVLYLINYDNAYHLKYKRQTRGDIAKDVITEKYVLGMRILMLGYEHALRALKGINGNGIGEYADDFRRMAARGAAATVLALAENLPKIVDTSSVSQDVE
jgi:hypothetical protein